MDRRTFCKSVAASAALGLGASAPAGEEEKTIVYMLHVGSQEKPATSEEIAKAHDFIVKHPDMHRDDQAKQLAQELDMEVYWQKFNMSSKGFLMVNVGDAERPACQLDIDDVKNALAELAESKPPRIMVTHHAVRAAWLPADSKAMSNPWIVTDAAE